MLSKDTLRSYSWRERNPEAFRESQRRSQEKRNARRRMLRHGAEFSSGAVAAVVVKSREFTKGGILLGFSATLKMGNAEPGMVVQWMGKTLVVEGEEGKPQRAVPICR